MAGYTLQGKTANGTMVDVPLAATYDAAGNNIQQHYAAKEEYEAIMAKLGTMDGKLDAIVGLSKDSSFAGASWATIKAISEAGLAPMVWSVGDEREIILTTGEKITMVILGFNHDNLTGGGKAGITLGTKNCLASAYVMNDDYTNAGGWKQSKMRTNTMEMIYGYLPDEVKAVIKSVDKVTALYENGGALDTTSDKLFLFSQREVMGNNMYSATSQNSFPNEGEQYEYFKNAPIPTPKAGTGAFSVLAGTGCFYTPDTAVANKYDNRFGQEKTTSKNVYYNFNNAKAQGDSATTACTWWFRSPCYNGSAGFCYVSTAGSSYGYTAGTSYGVAFGFCL